MKGFNNMKNGKGADRESTPAMKSDPKNNVMCQNDTFPWESQEDSKIPPRANGAARTGFDVAQPSTSVSKNSKTGFFTVADLPDALRPLLTEPVDRAPRYTIPACEIDTPENVIAAIEFAMAAAPAIQGQHGDDHTVKTVGMGLSDLGVSEQTALRILLKYWNDRCDPPWPIDELAKKIENAYQYARGQQGALSEEAIASGFSSVDEPGEFPTSVMAGLAGDFARLYAEYMEPPAAFFFLSFLTCLGNILAGFITLESQLRPNSRLYTLLLGQSADDRKSTAIAETVKFFQKSVQMSDTTLSICHGVGSGEGLAKRLAQSHRLLLLFDEFKMFVSKCKIEASILLSAVVTLFESNTYENYTKKSAVAIYDAHLSMLAACTLDTFQAMWTSAFTDIGLNNRLFLVTGSGERKFSIPQVVPIEKVQALATRLREIISGIGAGKIYSIDAAAFKLFDSWYLSLPKSIHAKRIDTLAMRLMVLLAANEQKDTIDVDIVKKAMRLADWQLEVRKRVDPIDADSVSAKLEEKIRRCLRTKGPLKEHELKDSVNAWRSGLWLYEQAKKNLISANEIQFHGKFKKFVLLSENGDGQKYCQNGCHGKNWGNHSN